MDLKTSPEKIYSKVEYWELPKEVFWSAEEAARGQEPSSRVLREAEGTDSRRLWILEEFGCRLQEGVPPCKSIMVQGIHCQDEWD
jgi:hypothetical protein